MGTKRKGGKIMQGFNKINLKTASLNELEEQCEYLQGSTYGHNMIGVIIGIVEDRFGEDEADRFFHLFQS